MGSSHALWLVVLVAPFTSAPTCAAVEPERGVDLDGATPNRTASPVAPHYAVAFEWLDGLHRGDESVLRRRSATPRDGTSAFFAVGFADRNGPCPSRAETPGEFTEQLHCMMRNPDAKDVPAAWTLRDLDSPARDPDAWGPETNASRNSLGAQAPAAHVLEWTRREPGAGGCLYRVAVDTEPRVIGAERACWLE